MRFHFSEYVFTRAKVGVPWGPFNVARVDEDADHHRNLFLGNQVVDYVEGWILSGAIQVPFAILKHHQRGWRFRIVFCWNVDPVFTFHTVVDLARVHDFGGERARWDAILLVGVGAERRKVEPAAELCAIDRVRERMQFSNWLDVSNREPQVRPRQIFHRDAGCFIN